MDKVKNKILGAIVCLLICFSSFLTIGSEEVRAEEWVKTGWSYRKLITIDSSLTDSDLTNFPVLLSFSDTDLASHAQADGDDIIFVLYDDGTQLNHEIVTYESGELLAWVNIPSLSSTEDTQLWMYYGNSAVTAQENPEGTWNENYMMVQHLDESPSDDVAGHIDSTSNNNDGTPKYFAGGDGSTSATGKVNGADAFGGDNDYVQVSASSSLNEFDSISVEGWFKLSTLNRYNPLIRKGESWNGDLNEDGKVDSYDWNLFNSTYGTATQGPPYPRWDVMDDGIVDLDDFVHFASDFSKESSLWLVQIADENNDGQKHMIFSLSGTENQLKSTKLFTDSDLDSWYNFVAVYDGSTSYLYINGALDNSISNTGSIKDTTKALMIGCAASANNHQPYRYYFDGTIDEIRISNTAQSSSWIQASYQIMNSPSTFLSFGNQESYEEPTPSQLVISAPSSAIEGETFEVTITADDAVVQNAEVTFKGITYSTNTEGKVIITAPQVDENTPYDITATHDDYISATATITVLNEDEPTPTLGWVYGSIVDSDALPISNAKVCVVLSTQGNAVTSKCTYSNSEGYFIINQIQTGTYVVELNKQGYTKHSEEITITANEGTNLDVTLEKIADQTDSLSDNEAITNYAFEKAIDEGKNVGAKITVAETEGENTVELYDNIDVDIIQQTKEKISFTVSADDATSGTFVVLYIEDEALLSSDIEVYYDSVQIDQMPISQFLNQEEITEPLYVFIQTEEGYWLAVYVPHFSEHTITISSIIDALSGTTAVVIYIVLAVVAFIIFLIPMIVRFLRRVYF